MTLCCVVSVRVATALEPSGRFAEKTGASHYWGELQETAEEKTQRIVVEEMKMLGGQEADLEQHRKGYRRKVKIARRLRQETTMTLKWIADRLKMGTWTHVSNRLYHLKTQDPSDEKINN